MASTNTFLTLLSTVQTDKIGSTITTGYIPYISTAGRQTYSNTLSTLTVSTLTTTTISGASRAPTVQRFIYTNGGTYTYVPTAGVVRIKVRMCGGGGSGASYIYSGYPGSSTSFDGWTCARGEAGIHDGQGGAGGTSTGTGDGTLIVRIPGGSGGGFQNQAYINGGSGGSNPFGGGGGGGASGMAGQYGAANTGAGGGGSGGYAGNAGSGGGAGEYLEFYISNPTSISYNVGGGGAPIQYPGGFASGGGAGGIIIVEEFYI